MEFSGRYIRNFCALSIDEQKLLGEKRICVIGCGGLGGYAVEALGRMGVQRITAVDGDVFEESNLNRQLFSNEKNMGASKAEEAKKRMAEINSSVAVEAVNARLSAENAEEILRGHSAVIDALDNINARLILKDKCGALNIPLVHGAISGWYGQVSTVLPGDGTLDIIYSEKKEIKSQLGNLPFTAAVVASIQASEAVKLLLGRGGLLTGGFLTIDLLNNDFEFINF